MKRLTAALSLLVALFSTGVSLITAAIWNEQWIYGLIGGVAIIVFIVVGGLLVPPARAAMPEEDRTLASALLQAFGALCTLLVLFCGLLMWIWGNQGHSSNTAYQVLGLLIFLAMLGIGGMGVVATTLRFFYLYNLAVMDRRRAEVTAAG